MSKDKVLIFKWGDNPYSFLEEAKELTFFTSLLKTPNRTEGRTDGRSQRYHSVCRPTELVHGRLSLTLNCPQYSSEISRHQSTQALRRPTLAPWQQLPHPPHWHLQTPDDLGNLLAPLARQRAQAQEA